MKTIQAELSNPQHPEYGVVTITFPIPDMKYKHVLELLESLEVGDYVKKDCRIGTLIDAPPVLSRLERTLINIDELDYLIKRLDSFNDYEIEQFQALVYAKEVSNVPDMINLTFNSQQVTVISDFLDLDAAGKQHYLTTHSGSAGIEEYSRVDGRQESLNLLCNQEGKVTPYGVLFENDLKMEQLYNGSSLPLYTYEPSILEVTLEDDAGQQLELLLPKPEMPLCRLIKRVNMDEDRIHLVSYESMLPEELDAAIDFKYDSIHNINQLCCSLAQFSQQDFVKLASVVQFAKPENASALHHLADNLALFDFYPSVQSPEKYGRYMIQKSGHFEYDPNLENCYDYKGFTQSRMSEYLGRFTGHGYVAYTGSISLDELMQDNLTEQSFQIGESNNVTLLNQRSAFQIPSHPLCCKLP